MILETLYPCAVICDETTKRLIEEVFLDDPVFLNNRISKSEIDDERLSGIRSHQIDTDSMYIVFTFGSTGMPKGVTACHRPVIDYIESLCEVFHCGKR